MGTTLTIVLPVFGLVATGWLVGRTRLLTPEGVRGINNFVLYVAISALLFRTAGSGRVVEAFEPGLDSPSSSRVGVCSVSPGSPGATFSVSPATRP
ncbi:MAG: hypothetical protein EXQ97_07690 [Alphaproteobacteria bacterium]|nr:hypothetical protein [Alphaproteobacteria bacterium]